MKQKLQNQISALSPEFMSLQYWTNSPTITLTEMNSNIYMVCASCKAF